MSSQFTHTTVINIAEQAGFGVVVQKKLPGRKPRYLPIPARLDRTVQNLLASSYPDGLYSHQSSAIEAVLDGEDICLATSTASGKSLIFMTAAIDILRHDSSAKVLALYPARALIQDQIQKWESVLKPLGMHTGYIDGGVPTKRRPEILRSARVVLMTPDVAHAWLMSHLGEPEVSMFMADLRLLILDEAHVYEGVFGTNMAYFLRRLQVASGSHQLICSTATLGMPADFVQQLTGRQPRCFGPNEDHSASPPKTILVAREVSEKSFESKVNLLVALSRVGKGRFLAFGDSRKMVEQLVAAAHRSENSDDVEIEDNAMARLRILPYRAGYETEDRNEIQKALGMGRLSGVVATSAMELGLDIGEIDLIVMLNLPPSVKAFWQRLGRAGRRNPGVCLLIDGRGTLADTPGGLDKYVEQRPEPNWLYLDNRYIQYINALCGALELSELGGSQDNLTPFESLPTTFRQFLHNEINPTEAVPSDLYPLKQRAQAGPHREFPIRSGVEQDFRVITPRGHRLGNLTFSQVLREGFPGAIYYYMAQPYRVYLFNYKNGEIFAERERHWTTQPLSQTMVFPRFQGGILRLLRSDWGFLAETEMQVSERVLGFTEQRGAIKEEHRYGPDSAYFQRELNRFFETTGVCWYFLEPYTVSAAMGSRVLEAFCAEFGVQERDLGVGFFHSQQSPLGAKKCQGMCVFDATSGSLRLTQRLAEHFADVLSVAISIARARHHEDALDELESLAFFVRDLRAAIPDFSSSGISRGEGDWEVIIAPGEKAIYVSQDGSKEVEVVGYRYTPHGLMYEMKPHQPDLSVMAIAHAIQPLHGQTKMIMANLVTGETRDIN